MCTNLYNAAHDTPSPNQALAGTLVSSLHRLKDIDNSGLSSLVPPLSFPFPNSEQILPDGGFFVFGDLSVKIEGHFRLRFSLFEMKK